MQLEIRALQPQLDNRRFRFDSSTGSTSSTRLDNGATLTFTQLGEPARNPRALVSAPGPERAPDSDHAPGGAEAAVADAPTKRTRLSSDEVSKRIPESAAEAASGAAEGKKAATDEEGGADAGAGPGAGAAAGPAAKAKAKPKAKAKAKGHGVKPGVCPLRCQHDREAKSFKCFWKKLNCKSFPYVSAKDKPRAQALANDWLKTMGAKHGCKAPHITF